MYTVLLFYKYTPIEDPEKMRDSQRHLCERLNLKGRLIVADEGLNVTLEGLTENVEEYIKELSKDPRFQDIQFKKSVGNGQAFPKLSVKWRKEIVAGRLGDQDIKPYEVTGQYIYAEQLHDWIHSGREFYIIDMRNDFEQEVGYFANSILPGMATFADLPKVLPKLAHLKDKTVVTICTGGVRCEKASGYLLTQGFKDVYQLYGGIVTYMEAYPNEDFKGQLYVFDGRLTMGFNLDDPKREIVGKCASCGKPSEAYVNCKDDFCHRHFICCMECRLRDGSVLCPMGCRPTGSAQHIFH